MFSLARFIALSLTLGGLTGAAPSLVPVASTTGPTRLGGYIVTLKSGAVARRSPAALLSAFSALDAGIKYEWPRLNAFAGTLSDAALNGLRASREVEAIEHDAIGGEDELVSQTDAPWGLPRILQIPKLDSTDVRAVNYTYIYDNSAGKGVDIYLIDSGINLHHEDFEGRARWGITYGGFTDEDERGHRTHLGIAAGKRFGVAKAANLVAVRILSRTGQANISDVIAAVDWVVTEAARTHSSSLHSLRTSPADRQLLEIRTGGNIPVRSDPFSPSDDTDTVEET